jgi:uncharacterized membrane protein YkoI
MYKVLLASVVILGLTAFECPAKEKSESGECKVDSEKNEACEHEKGQKKDETREEKVSADQVPAGVMAAFKKAFPDVTIEKIKKETYTDGTVHYEFEYKDKDGKKHEVELNSDGEVLEDH